MPYEVNFNKAAYEGKSKAEFLENEKHHEELGVNLNEAWDKMFPEKEKQAADKKAAKEAGKQD